MGRRYFPFEMAPSKMGTFVGFRWGKKWSISVDVLDGGQSLTHATSWSSWQEVSSIPSFVGFFPHPILKKYVQVKMFITSPRIRGEKYPKYLEVSPPRFRFGSVSNRSEDIMRISKKASQLNPPKKPPPLKKHSLRYWWQNWAWRVDGRVGCHRGCWSSYRGFWDVATLKNHEKPQKLNGWKLRMKILEKNGNSSEPNHHFQVRAVNLRGVYDIHYTDWFIGILILAYFLLPI